MFAMTASHAQELERRLRDIGAERYHDKHPFHILMRDGKLTKGQVQAWALNRYYYQSRIPIKDSALMARLVDFDLRRIWSQRVIDHDGTREGRGGLERWLHLCERLGLARDDVLAERGILPATKFAVEAYVTFVKERPLLEAIASSLTELFAPRIIGERTAAMLERYDFVDKDMLSYFDQRLVQAPRDADFALDYVKRHAKSEAERRAVCDALIFKTDVLWAQLDALHFAYVAPGLPPPGAFVPDRQES
jgi:coenzyme PQQ biosynthesis protein C